jgi:5-methylcytosine-specific restriction endonuclease McrA
MKRDPRRVPLGVIPRMVLVQSIRRLCWIRDRRRCHYCGVRLVFHKTTLDHRVPAGKGGELSVENSVCACADCNSRKGVMDYDEFCRAIGKLPTGA